jgi:hypothetical protein
MRSASGNESKSFEDVLSDDGGAEFWAWDPWEAVEAEAVEGSVSDWDWGRTIDIADGTESQRFSRKSHKSVALTSAQ